MIHCCCVQNIDSYTPTRNDAHRAPSVMARNARVCDRVFPNVTARPGDLIAETTSGRDDVTTDGRSRAPCKNRRQMIAAFSLDRRGRHASICDNVGAPLGIDGVGLRVATQRSLETPCWSKAKPL